MNRTPRVAAVHDLSGLGRCSLSVILPVLSVMGIQCCPLPTAVLSAHTAFPAAKSASFLDLTPEMEQGTRHWRELGMDFDAIYSGFLGSAGRSPSCAQFIHDFRREDTLVLVDPVMGDHGKVYRTYTPEMCRLMGELAAPGRPHHPQRHGGRHPAGGGLRQRAHHSGGHGELAGPAVAGRSALGGDYRRELRAWHGRGGLPGLPHRKDPLCRGPAGKGAVFRGTGDLFASVVLGSILRGEQLPIATNRRWSSCSPAPPAHWPPRHP